jgi:cell division protein FtsL
MTKKRIETNKKKNNQTIIWSILVLVFVAELFLYTWCRVQCMQAGFDISRESAKHQMLTDTRYRLKIELESLKSPERIARIARDRFGLEAPKPEQIIIIQ